MRRDMDLVRKVLLAVEADQGDPRAWVEVEVPGHDHQEMFYHIQVLAEGGFLEADDVSSHDGYDWRVRRLTREGHEFLDTIRDPEIWRRTKKTLGSVGAAGLRAVYEVAKSELKQVLEKGLPLG